MTKEQKIRGLKLRVCRTLHEADIELIEKQNIPESKDGE